MAEETDPLLLARAGDTGLKVSGGAIYEEYLTSLKGRRGIEVYQQMLDSPLPSAFMLLVELIARRIDWKAKPAIENNAAATAEAERLDGMLADMETSWTDIVVEALSSIAFGWSRHEILYKLRRGPHQMDPSLRSDFSDGLWGWRDFDPRSQDSLDRWEFERDVNGKETTRVCGMWQQVPERGGRFFVPESKVFAAIPRPHKRSPEGRSMFRPAYRPWFFAQKLEDFEAIGIERDMNGVPVMQLPTRIMAATSGDALTTRRDWEAKMPKIRNGQMAGLIVPAEEEGGNKTGFKFGLLASGGSGRVPFDPTIRRHESRELIAFLSEFLVMGVDMSSSLALGKTKYNMIELAMAGLLDAAIVAPFNTKAIPDLWRLNGVPDELWPTIDYGELSAPDLQEFAGQLTQLVNGGLLTPSIELEQHVRQKFGLPDPQPHEIVSAALPVTPTAPSVSPAPATPTAPPTT